MQCLEGLAGMQQYKITRTVNNRLSPWVDLITKTVISPYHTEPQTYHSFSQSDYVNVLAVTKCGLIPMVRQYRAAIDRYTLELPGGLRERDETPEDTVKRELLEETGCHTSGQIVSLGFCYPDPGRLENRLWGYFAPDVTDVDLLASTKEQGLEVFMTTKNELEGLVLSGKIEHAGHSWLIAQAILRKIL
jgi:ADP-ribose pyrophosphatase